MAGLVGCSSNDILEGDRIDYRSQSSKTAPLDIPPDLTQLQRDTRYVPQSGAVSAAAYQAAPPASAPVSNAGATIAPQAVGNVRLERAGDERWLATDMPPETLWPKIRTFWQEAGLGISYENADAGVMETEWAENRAKIPSDALRNALGRMLDSLYSSGERDKFRTRIERTATGSEIYIAHRGMQEVYTDDTRERTVWTPRPSDPSLEAEFMSRLMVKLGSREETARAVVADTSTPQAPRARVVPGQPAATLEVDDPYDRAWRRVGTSLDRSGFTVEDRDRAGGIYFVRYIDPSEGVKEEPGFFKKLFSSGSSKSSAPTSNRYRIAVKGGGERTTVTVLNDQGAPEAGPVGQRIVSLLVADLK